MIFNLICFKFFQHNLVIVFTGWLRLLHHCFSVVSDSETKKRIVEGASQVDDLLTTCCNLLLVPSHILPVYLPCLEKVSVLNLHLSL